MPRYTTDATDAMHLLNSIFCRGLVVVALGAFSGCGALNLALPPVQVPAGAPIEWKAPLPHQGGVAALSQWWQKQGDPLLIALMDAAQMASPTVAQAQARIASARATQAQAQAALLPGLSAQTSAARGLTQAGSPSGTALQSVLSASWELDLVGANRTLSEAAGAQVQSAQAQWHDARVSVAAEVAQWYFDLRTCQQLAALAQLDAQSHQETARLSTLNAEAGFISAAQAGLAHAAAAESRARQSQQLAQCDSDIKALVSLSAMPEEHLRSQLRASQGTATLVAPIVAQVPANTLAQRPDVFSAERNVMVTAAAVGNAIAQRLPRLSLNGSIGAMRVSTGGLDQDASTWSFGPLALSLPIYDAGQREAAVAAAQASYQSAVLAYQATVRQAVREAEEAMVRLQSLQDRERDAALVQQSYATALEGAQNRQRQGLASDLELQDARRAVWASESARLALQLQTKMAWVALYRALGGGFDPTQP